MDRHTAARLAADFETAALRVIRDCGAFSPQGRAAIETAADAEQIAEEAGCTRDDIVAARSTRT